jgi:protein-S-isoprenylcysteine O-methyltransferase Ste14
VPSQTPQTPLQQPIADPITRTGGWLFKRRTLIPVPLAVPLLLLRIGEASPSTALLAGGAAIVAAGEIVRLWAVHHIGVISRTRSDRLGPLVETGPFAIVRNPLYLGNVALWIGFAVLARMLWMVPVIALVLGVEYHAIVRWEEQLLESRVGEGYRAYAARVPRWLPRLTPASGGAPDTRHSWRHTFFSERGTLTAIFVASVLLWIKARF